MATGPINYAVGMPDLTNAFSNFNVALSGYMKRDKALRDEAEKKAKEEAFAARLKEVLSSGDQRALLDLQIENPDKFEFARGAWDQLKDDEKKAQFGKLSEVRTALRTAPEVGVRMIRDHVIALENSGQDASQFKELLRVAELDPEAAAQSFEMLMTVADPDAVKKIYDTEGVKTGRRLEERRLDLQERSLDIKEAGNAADAEYDAAKRREAIAKADLAEYQARNAPQKTIDAAQAAADRAEASAARLAAERERIEDARRKQAFVEEQGVDKKLSETNDDINSLRGEIEMAEHYSASVDAAMGKLVMSTDASGRPTSFTGAAEAATGPISSRLPTARRDVADFENAISTVKSQLALTQLPKMRGMGALSTHEFTTLEKSVASLELNQSPRQLAENLSTIKRLVTKMNVNAARIMREKKAAADRLKARRDELTPKATQAPVSAASSAQPGSMPQTKSYARFAAPAQSSTDDEAWMAE